MKTRSGIAAGLVVLGSVLMASLWWGLQHAALSNPPVLGNTAPQLAIKTLAGTRIGVSDLRGKPVVINFWASWCAPCIEELPVLSSASSAHPEIAFLGAAMRDTASGVGDFEQRHPHPYPVGPIVSGSYQSYGVAGLPVTFFVNSQGFVTASFAGPLDLTILDHYLGLITT